MLRSGEPALLILANKAMRGRALELAGKVAAGTGCRLAIQFFTARIERGAGRVPLERIPYSVAPALAFLEGTSSTSSRSRPRSRSRSSAIPTSRAC